MRNRVKAVCVLVASLGLVATGCGDKHKAMPSSGGYAQPSSAGPESSPPSTEEPGEESPSAGPESSPPAASTSPGGPVELKAKDTAAGKILVDGKDMTLYVFDKDKGGKSSCTDACEADWPPLATDEAPKAGDGVNAAWLGTTDRPDGTKQVTYHGWPLYHYAKDTKAGDMNGQGVTAFGGTWNVIDATKGEKVEKK